MDKFSTLSKMRNTSSSTIPPSKKELVQIMATHSPLDLKFTKFQALVVLSADTKSTSLRNHKSSIKLEPKDADKSRLSRPMLHQPSHTIKHSSQELAQVKDTQNSLEIHKFMLLVDILVPSALSMSLSTLPQPLSIKLDQKVADKFLQVQWLTLHQLSHTILHSSQELALVKDTPKGMENKMLLFQKSTSVATARSTSLSSRNHLLWSSMVLPTLTCSESSERQIL